MIIKNGLSGLANSIPYKTSDKILSSFLLLMTKQGFEAWLLSTRRPENTHSLKEKQIIYNYTLYYYKQRTDWTTQ